MDDLKKCLDCEEPIKGRVDKKFCSDLCRNSYYNKQNRDGNNYVRKVNSMLRKNRRILEQLTPNEIAKVSKKEMSREGFNFDYYTNVYQTKTGKTYFFCYEYGYLELENEMYALVLRKEYVK